MIPPLPRPASFDAPPPLAAAVSVNVPHAEARYHQRPQPIEAVEPDARVRRDEPARVAPPPRPDAEGDPFDTRIAGSDDATSPGAIVPGPYGWLGLASAPFVAQLVGQGDAPRNPVAAGRSPTSFRGSPVDRYEEVQGWGRRIELMFAFEGMITAAAS